MKPGPPNPGGWSGRRWAMALALLLLVTLTPLLWIQWQQYRMLADLAVHQVDSPMWQAYQLEREAMRLRHSLQDAANPATTAATDPLALSERYEVFLSRVDLMINIPRQDLLSSSTEFHNGVALVKDFERYADPIFAKPQQLIADSTLRAQVMDRLQAMDAPLSELTRKANQAVSRFLDQRNQQLREQAMLVWILASIQIAIMLLFVGMLVRHIRRQQRQYAELASLNQELASARDLAEAANHGKSVFLANMSHEIRTPFQGLLGMLNVLDDATLTGQQRDYLQTARDSALHLLGVLNDILDVSTMESGTLKLSTALVHLPGVIQEVDGLMQLAARDKGLSLRMGAAGDLPEWVSADATRLRQIMFNLINNAIKFTERGSISAELARDPQAANGVVFTVRDTGLGMDATTQQQLFNRFYQADSSLRRRVGGSGLGLEISRNLARMMGGDIAVHSSPGVGSVFTVKLHLPPAAPPGEDATLGAEVNATRPLRILVAEDHPINLKYMGILLKRMGHEATFCGNGQEALALLQSRPFDLVLLDYHMPVLDGLAATEAIRALEGPLSQVKIILVTADVVNDTRQRAHDAGVDAFASKPLQIEDLQKAMVHCGLMDPEPVAASEDPDFPHNHFLFSSYELTIPLPDAEQPINALIDAESFHQMVDMMPAASLDGMLRSVFDAPDGNVHVLARCIEAGDRAGVGFNAHKLKGAAMLMGFRALVVSSAQIEHLATHTQDPIGRAQRDDILHEAALTQKAIQRFKRSAQHPPAADLTA